MSATVETKVSGGHQTNVRRLVNDFPPFNVDQTTFSIRAELSQDDSSDEQARRYKGVTGRAGKDWTSPVTLTPYATRTESNSRAVYPITFRHFLYKPSRIVCEQSLKRGDHCRRIIRGHISKFQVPRQTTVKLFPQFSSRIDEVVHETGFSEPSM